MVITILIVWEAIQRFRHPQPIAGATMMVIAVAGLVANIRPSGFCTAAAGKEPQRARGGSACAGDLLGSVGAIVAALVILYTGWTPVDPILSVLVSCLVLRSTAAAEGERE